MYEFFSRRLKPLAVVAGRPFTFFIVLTIWVGICSYYSGLFDTEKNKCKDLQVRIDEAVQTNRAAQSMALNLRIYAIVSEMRAQNSKSPVDLSKIYSDIDTVDKKIANSFLDATNQQAENSKLCDEIGLEKSDIDVVYIFASALLAIFGFWVGSRK